jgi:hypothetical protein
MAERSMVMTYLFPLARRMHLGLAEEQLLSDVDRPAMRWDDRMSLP